MKRGLRWGGLVAGLVLAGLPSGGILAVGEQLSVPGQFRTIGDAIAAAKPGALISLAEGVYEENLVLAKPLTIRGENADRVTIQGGTGCREGRPGILIVAPNVRLENLTVQGCPVGISVRGSVEVVGVNIVKNGVGLEVGDFAELRVTLSYIRRNTVGIELWALAAGTLDSCYLEDNGIGVKALRGSRLSVVGGLVQGNGVGVEVWDAAEATLTDASITGNQGHGVWIWGTTVGQVRLLRCTVDRNGGSGIRLGALGYRPDSMQVDLTRNVIRSNGLCGIWVDVGGAIQVTGRENKLSDNLGGDLCPRFPNYPWPADFVDEEDG